MSYLAQKGCGCFLHIQVERIPQIIFAGVSLWAHGFTRAVLDLWSLLQEPRT